MNPVTNIRRFLYLPLANFLIRIYRLFVAKSSQYFARISRKLVQVLIRVTKTKKRGENDRRYSSKIWNKIKIKIINLNWQVRPKFLWSSAIFVLLIVSAIFYVVKEQEKSLRISTQRQLVVTNKNTRIVANKLVETVEVKKKVQEELSIEKRRTTALEKEVKEKNNQIKLALDKLENEIVARREVEAQLILTMARKKVLEAKLKEFTGENAVELEKIVVGPSPESPGIILAANKEHGFVVVDLGKRDDMEIGNILSIYRDDELVGKARVERIEESFCAAFILSEWKDVEFKQKDIVKR